MELSLPAGNLQSAIVAFENGADSVYFGFKDFSMRKRAENFSFDDFLRIKRYAEDNNKKIYVTLNTLIEENDIKNVYKILKFLDFYKVDGIIICDYNILNIAKKYFPSLTLHSSTQMCAINSQRVKILKEMGFKRVVLSRELSIDEIKKIREEHRDVELKIFIHGALCYCISGLCRASEAFSSRSQNDGDCIGVCRWKFKDESGKISYPFSLSDLQSNKEIIKDLESIGVDALKVEGRLKNTSYIKWTTKYYRAIIDKKDDKTIEFYKTKSETAFSRETSTGYFYKNKNGVSTRNPDHTGTVIGEFITPNSVKLSSVIKTHDGLMYFNKREECIKFSLGFNHSKDTLVLKNSDAKIGEKLYKIKDEDENEKSFNPLSYKKYKKSLGLNIKLNENSITINDKTYSLNLQKANKIQNTEENIKKIFTTQSEIFETTIENIESFIPLSDLFVSIKELKAIRNTFIQDKEKQAQNYLNEIPEDLEYKKFTYPVECEKAIFTSLSGLPKDGVYTSCMGGKERKLKVVKKGRYTFTYLVE